MVPQVTPSLQGNALTWASFSPLQGEGRGFETLSAHREKRLFRDYVLGDANPSVAEAPPQFLAMCPGPYGEA